MVFLKLILKFIYFWLQIVFSFYNILLFIIIQSGKNYEAKGGGG